MLWARMLAYITGTVDQELLLRNEYLAAANRILELDDRASVLEQITECIQEYDRSESEECETLPF